MKKIDGKEVKVYEEHYYPDGKKRCYGACKDDKRTGIWKFNYEDGTLFAQADFTNRREGQSWQIKYNKDSLLVDKQDTIVKIAFADEGTPVYLTVRHQGQETFYRFFNSFKLMKKVSLKGNIPNGEAISWFENGKINSIHYYKDGYQDSTYTVYAENGQEIISGQYLMDKKVGKWQYHSSTGADLGIEVYDVDGTKLISRKDEGIQIIGRKK